MARGLTDPIEEPEADNSNEQAELLYEIQEVLQELIRKHNELYDKHSKLEDSLTNLRIESEALKLVWQKGL